MEGLVAGQMAAAPKGLKLGKKLTVQAVVVQQGKTPGAKLLHGAAADPDAFGGKGGQKAGHRPGFLLLLRLRNQQRCAGVQFLRCDHGLGKLQQYVGHGLSAAETGGGQPVLAGVFFPQSKQGVLYGLQLSAVVVAPQIHIFGATGAQRRLHHMGCGAVHQRQTGSGNQQTVQRIGIGGTQHPLGGKPQTLRHLAHGLHERGLAAARAAFQNQDSFQTRILKQRVIKGTEALRRGGAEKTDNGHRITPRSNLQLQAH